MWEKYTLWEETTRVPLLISDPRDRSQWGLHWEDPVELLDVLPTIIDLLNISFNPVLCPRSRICADFDGKSLAGVVRKHQIGDPPPWGVRHSTALSQVRRCPQAKGTKKRIDKTFEHLPTETAKLYDTMWHTLCNLRNRKEPGSLMGYSLRTSRYRYTGWFQYDQNLLRPLTEEPLIAQELYCHADDAVGDINTERVNLVEFPDAIQRSRCSGDDVVSVLSDNRRELIEILRRKIVFGESNLAKRTQQQWGSVFRLDKKNRPQGVKKPHLLKSSDLGSVMLL